MYTRSICVCTKQSEAAPLCKGSLSVPSVLYPRGPRHLHTLCPGIEDVDTYIRFGPADTGLSWLGRLPGTTSGMPVNVNTRLQYVLVHVSATDKPEEDGNCKAFVQHFAAVFATPKELGPLDKRPQKIFAESYRIQLPDMSSATLVEQYHIPCVKLYAALVGKTQFEYSAHAA